MQESNMIIKLTFLIITAVCLPISAQLRLPAIIGDNMVIQRDTLAPFWGWAQPYQKVDVKGSWMVLPRSSRANSKGEWSLRIRTPEAGGPYSIVIQSGNEFNEIKNVMSGEVWICSGQSNMDFPLHRSNEGPEAVINSNLPRVRLFKVPHSLADSPLEQTQAQWRQSSPETTPDFSAIGFYYARLLHEQLEIPVGIIQASWGGTPAESWMRKEALAADKDFHPILGRFGKSVKDYNEKLDEYESKLSRWLENDNEDKGARPEKPQLRTKNSPASLYNAMISPLIPFKIKGVIWYQGEANRKRGWQYRKLFPALIENWRSDWNHGPFPFYFVQIAPYKYGDEDKHHIAELREAQLHTMNTVVNTGMAVTIDIGDVDDIHPKNKSAVANRLFLWAMAKDYERRNVVYSGPVYKSMVVEDDKIRLMFDHIGQGLVTSGFRSLEGFEIAGQDREFHPGYAIIERNTVLVSSSKVPRPVAVRYGWDKTPVASLFNRQGLPASPFRTDDWPAKSLNEK
jgi:sialate O-acetylesterase